MNVNQFRKQVKSPLFNIFLFRKMPLAFFAGVKVKQLTDELAITTMRFSWLNQNPFRSMYFAAMSMGAELATGLHLFQYQDLNFSMLLIETKATFYKKAVGRIRFECNQGMEAKTCVHALLEDKEASELDLLVRAYNQDENLLAEFSFKWSLKKRPRS